MGTVLVRNKLRRLERAAREDLSSFELEDGNQYWYNPQQAGLELLLYSLECLGLQGEGVPYPEPPELIHAIARAKDRAGALTELMGSLTVGYLPFEPEPLLERGELVYRSLVVGRELEDGPTSDLSE
jgi:hypothetical protein